MACANPKKIANLDARSVILLQLVIRVQMTTTKKSMINVIVKFAGKPVICPALWLTMSTVTGKIFLSPVVIVISNLLSRDNSNSTTSNIVNYPPSHAASVTEHTSEKVNLSSILKYTKTKLTLARSVNTLLRIQGT